MQTFHRLKWEVVVLLLISFITLVPIRTFAEDEYLIVRIVDADYPPSVKVQEDKHRTTFTFFIDYQTENPTSSPINVTYVCGPYPFPYLRTNLRDKSLKATHIFSVQWPAGETSIQPGFRNDSQYLSFRVENYVNESLPLGTYELWFDYTNCSSSPVPVVTEKMYIDVTETSVTYYFDYNNESRVVSSLQQTDYIESLFIICLLLVVKVYSRWYGRKR
ncbi:MAG: hypothetical protein KAS63_10145 [Candidatus Heimdallarchaeota archaeon]|nr:hypothetical protein [Candidatus Heimdallarchaeota archaeon]MCK4955713.1 hypothetical protein [Candidatus Heimdallarchaeota archaeon]